MRTCSSRFAGNNGFARAQVCCSTERESFASLLPQGMPAAYEAQLENVATAISLTFVLEMALKLLGLGCVGYWSDNWVRIAFYPSPATLSPIPRERLPCPGLPDVCERRMCSTDPS